MVVKRSTRLSAGRSQALSPAVQIIQQDPYASLNPTRQHRADPERAAAAS